MTPLPETFSDDLGSGRYLVQCVDLAGNSWEEGQYHDLRNARTGAFFASLGHQVKRRKVLVRVVDLEKDGAPVGEDDDDPSERDLGGEA